MGVKLTMVKQPATAKIRKGMLAVVRRTLHQIAAASEKRLGGPVKNWRGKPEFYNTVRVGKRWRLAMMHRSKIPGGVNYDRVRKGTGLHGPSGQAYPIFPKNAKVLRFVVPSSPKTLAPGQSRPTGPSKVIFVTMVNKPGQTHPGIKPRNDAVGFPGHEVDTYYRNKSKAGSFVRMVHSAVGAYFRSVK